MQIPNTKNFTSPSGKKILIKGTTNLSFWQEFSAHYMVINTNLYAKKVRRKNNQQPFFFVPIFILFLCQTAIKLKQNILFSKEACNVSENCYAEAEEIYTFLSSWWQKLII